MRSTASDLPVLRWFGPWRASAFLAKAEHTRTDLTGSLFMGTRVSFSPVPIIEFGLSRTAQFCGQNQAGTRPKCGLKQIFRSFTGTDNLSGDVSLAEEPGNQMAGYETRIISPFKPLPLAIYGQFIGEDATHRMPLRFLVLYGIEGWTQLDSGSSLRAQVEYASTSCKQTMPEPGCAYTNHIFNGGYQFLGRSLGYTSDADSQLLSTSFRLTQSDGQVWSLKTRNGQINRFGAAARSTVSLKAATFGSAELGWRGDVLGLDLSVTAGYERLDPNAGPRSDGPYGFIRWQQRL